MSSVQDSSLRGYDGQIGHIDKVFVKGDGSTRALVSFQGQLGTREFKVPADYKPGQQLRVTVEKRGLFKRSEASVRRVNTSPEQPMHGIVERVRGKPGKLEIDVKVNDEYSIRVPLSSANRLEPRLGSPAMVVNVDGAVSGTVLESSPQPEQPQRAVTSWQRARPSKAAVKKVQDEIARQTIVPAVTPTPAMSQPEDGETVSRKKGSPLKARGRFSDMSAYNGRTGVVQFTDVDNGEAYASVKFDRSIEGVNDVKLIPLSAFPNAYVQTEDHVTVYVGNDRNGDQRSLPRRVLEGIGLLKQSTRVEATIQAEVVSYASAQNPDRDTVVDPAPSVHASDRGIATRIASGLERIGSRVTVGAAALSQAIGALRNSLLPASASQPPELTGKAQQVATNFTEISASDVARLQDRGVVSASPDQHNLTEEEVVVDPSNVAPAQQVDANFTEISASDVARLQDRGVVSASPDQGNLTVEFAKPAQRIGQQPVPAPENVIHSSQRAVRFQAADLSILPPPQRAVSFAQPQPLKATMTDVRKLQTAQQFGSPPEAKRDITPEARAKASLSKDQVRAIALEKASKSAARGKGVDQDKGR